MEVLENEINENFDNYYNLLLEKQNLNKYKIQRSRLFAKIECHVHSLIENRDSYVQKRFRNSTYHKVTWQTKDFKNKFSSQNNTNIENISEEKNFNDEDDSNGKSKNKNNVLSKNNNSAGKNLESSIEGKISFKYVNILVDSNSNTRDKTSQPRNSKLARNKNNNYSSSLLNEKNNQVKISKRNNLNDKNENENENKNLVENINNSKLGNLNNKPKEIINYSQNEDLKKYISPVNLLFFIVNEKKIEFPLNNTNSQTLDKKLEFFNFFAKENDLIETYQEFCNTKGNSTNCCICLKLFIEYDTKVVCNSCNIAYHNVFFNFFYINYK